MIEWLQLSDTDKIAVLREASTRTGIAVNAIEKDWWVTLTLRACFLTPWRDNLVFKGGTSLSKAWALIERFSEDIDLVMDREALGFKGELSNTQIKKLREKTAAFMATEFLESLYAVLIQTGLDPQLIRLEVKPGGVADRDPQVLELHYHSVLQPDGYLEDKVIIEIGARSLMEPASDRTIHSIIGTTFPDQSYAGSPFTVLCVDPRRTFLEKVFLLHEEFSKSTEKIRHERMSRHLYDLDRLMDTEFGIAALADKDLYQIIVQHRSKYTPIKGIDYKSHAPATISFIPPEAVAQMWERDYLLMQESMIYGSSPTYVVLLERMELLKQRFRGLGAE